MSKFILLAALFLLFFLNENLVHAQIIEANQPYTYESFESDILYLKEKYPDIIGVKPIGTTYFGRDIWAVHLGRGKTNILLIGAHHGREWLTSTLLMRMLESYSEVYQINGKIENVSTEILDEVSIWFVPMLNPDGVSIQQNQLPPFYYETLLQMNGGCNCFKRWKANGVGIDLNRQYPSGWKSLQGVSRRPFYQYYKGTKPLQAKEVRALVDFVKVINPSIAVAYHSAGREIFWHYKNGKNNKRDYQIAKKAADITGYSLGKPNKNAVGGGFTDWFISTFHKPAMTIEISPLVGETNPPLSIFQEEWERNRLIGLKLAKEAKKIKP